MKVIAIDPGPTRSGWVIFDVDNYKVVDKGVSENDDLLKWLPGLDSVEHLVVEQVIQYRTFRANADVFETAFWAGRFVQAWGSWFSRFPKPDVSYHLCGRRSVKDSDTRMALTALLGEKGTKKAPGGMHGITGTHMLDALALAVKFADEWRLGQA